MDFQLMRHLALLTILFRSLFWNSFFPWLFHLFTLTGVRVFKNLQFDEAGDKEGVWRSVWFSRNFLNLDQIRFKLSLRHLSLASIFVQAWSYLDICFSRFTQRNWVSFSNRRYIFRGGFRGALPPYSLQSLVFFAITLKNYKLCYRKLNINNDALLHTFTLILSKQF